MKCPKCNFDIPENNKFCPECGEKTPEIIKPKVQETPVQEPFTPVTAEKKPKNKKIKKILIISISSVVACGLIFLILFLINPFCMFGHRNSHVEGNDATCTMAANKSHICDDCGDIIWIENYSALGHRYEYKEITCKYCGEKRSCEDAGLKHTFTNAVCGYLNTCTTCGTQKKIEHSFSGVSCEYCGEMKYKISTEKLPISVNTYDYSGNTKQSCVVTNISYSMYYSMVQVNFTVKSTYHENGNNYSSEAKFGWKLYDEDGTVLDSGTAYSDGTIKVGEQSKGHFLIDVEPDVKYRLEILNLR